MSAFAIAAGVYGVAQPIAQPSAVRRPSLESLRAGSGGPPGVVAVPAAQAEQPSIAPAASEASDGGAEAPRQHRRETVSNDVGKKPNQQPSTEAYRPALSARFAALRRPPDDQPTSPPPRTQPFSSLFLAHQFGQERIITENTKIQPLTAQRGFAAYAKVNAAVGGGGHQVENLADVEGSADTPQTHYATATFVNLAA